MDMSIEALFAAAGCDGQLCVQSLDCAGELAVHADQEVAPASVFKVSVALEAETQFADGRLDPRERVILPATSRTPGRATRTTPRDMATLLRLIWTDQAGPPAACLRVRKVMSQQLTRPERSA
jgi:Beta-lactamase enzyme family